MADNRRNCHALLATNICSVGCLASIGPLFLSGFQHLSVGGATIKRALRLYVK